MLRRGAAPCPCGCPVPGPATRRLAFRFRGFPGDPPPQSATHGGLAEVARRKMPPRSGGMMDRNEHHTGDLERFLALGAETAPGLREFIFDGSATGLTRLRTAEGEDWIIACVDVGTVP